MISEKEVQHIAKLARLNLNQEEIKRIQKDLSSILDYFNLLEEIDTKDIEITFHFREKDFSSTRTDKVKKQSPDTVNKLIKMAPDEKKRYIRVKSIFS